MTLQELIIEPVRFALDHYRRLKDMNKRPSEVRIEQFPQTGDTTNEGGKQGMDNINVGLLRINKNASMQGIPNLFPQKLHTVSITSSDKFLIMSILNLKILGI